ncbi:unnamed protein product [Linum tenue]|uniref:Mitochondrial import receptor subunit TOM20 n=1 Tax=Linum tenue TaxID=586396 RepID=A0AAV0S561_9ROSI|nr:unnamed protein product [Linum tenue]
MEFSEDDFTRLLVMEQARKTAEANYAKNPLDADNLTKWGGALLQLCQLERGPEAMSRMINEAVSKFEEALGINPSKHEALWGMGNAETNLAFLTPDPDQADGHFSAAAQLYQRALDEAPNNLIYQQSLMEVSKAPEIHRQAFAGGHPALGDASVASSTTKGSRNKKGSKTKDLIYDACGWIILVAGVATVLAMSARSRSQLPPPPPPF